MAMPTLAPVERPPELETGLMPTALAGEVEIAVLEEEIEAVGVVVAVEVEDRVSVPASPAAPAKLVPLIANCLL